MGGKIEQKLQLMGRPKDGLWKVIQATNYYQSHPLSCRLFGIWTEQKKQKTKFQLVPRTSTIHECTKVLSWNKPE